MVCDHFNTPMKNLITITFLFLSLALFSQTNISTIITDLKLKNEETVVNTKKANRLKYTIRKGSFKKIKRGKIIEIYLENGTNSEFCLFPLNSKNEFDIYAIGSHADIDLEMNTYIPTAFDSFILYDNKTDNLYYLESAYSAGSIARFDKNHLKLNVTLKHIRPNIIKLNHNFKPESSITYYPITDSTSVYKMATYEWKGHYFIKRIKNIENKYLSTTLMPYDELTSALNSKPIAFDSSERCDDYCCKYGIFRLFMPVKN